MTPDDRADYVRAMITALCPELSDLAMRIPTVLICATKGWPRRELALAVQRGCVAALRGEAGEKLGPSIGLDQGHALALEVETQSPRFRATDDQG